MLNGWIVLDKPSGITSAHAVAKVKRLLSSLLRAEGEAILSDSKAGLPRRLAPRNDKIKIGHAGTLDPLASGILPLALGEATKTVNYMMDASKAYAFTVAWGAETETDDLEGKVTNTCDLRPTQAQILALLPDFTGEIEQTPPSYSAIKVEGKRAYDMARSGEAPVLKSRKVRVDVLVIAGEAMQSSAGSLRPGGLAMTEEAADFTTFICHCGKGTYIRSLARDMGRQLGCYGHVTMLRRLKVGKFTETQAISLEKLAEMVHKGDLGFLQPVASALDDIPAVSVTSLQAASLTRGQTVSLPSHEDQSVVSVLSDGRLIAIGEVASGVLKSRRIFNISGQ